MDDYDTDYLFTIIIEVVIEPDDVKMLKSLFSVTGLIQRLADVKSDGDILKLIEMFIETGEAIYSEKVKEFLESGPNIKSAQKQ